MMGGRLLCQARPHSQSDSLPLLRNACFDSSVCILPLFAPQRCCESAMATKDMNSVLKEMADARDVAATITKAAQQMSEFLGRFENRCRFGLAKLEEQLMVLEKRLVLLETRAISVQKSTFDASAGLSPTETTLPRDIPSTMEPPPHAIADAASVSAGPPPPPPAPPCKV
ncbi:uncharacterized protein BJ171DRAFT_500038 [Polychytrium aggregatum]|uniref:uncharacterized protein n=1 Tax=Polychytrium aggregatum TaxID=110093 RepID=UPI0022FE7467|nr:uncharacterized protein BJ171DRAFT_500038 [Polychytrium aggregatum]KAI9205877.1 hypothetical protein BJ171DRAFT_500038 [Polychytrium aggregatum]